MRIKSKSGGGNRHAYVCDVSCVHEFAIAFHLLAPTESSHQPPSSPILLCAAAMAAICAVAGCNKHAVGGYYGGTCGYKHFLLWTEQDDAVLYPKCDGAGFYVLHHLCTYVCTSIGWDGIRAVVTASLGFDSCAVCCAFVFPNAGCNRLKTPECDGCCSWKCLDTLGGGAAAAEEWLTCVVPHCNKKRGDPYYGAKYFVFINYLIYLIYSGGNRLCYF